MVNLLRSGLVRNLGNITATKLYNKSFAGTKFLIEEYITQVAEAIGYISGLPAVPPSGVGFLSNPGTTMTNGAGASSSAVSAQAPIVHFNDNNSSTTPGSSNSNASGGAASIKKVPMTMPNQMKLDFVHDTRQAFGRSTLVLQGGAIFGLCHLGVVKALFLRGLLPRIITGTATGALIAALVAIHKEEELPGVLKGDGIDLSAFANHAKEKAQEYGSASLSTSTRWGTLLRRVRRFYREGYFLDVKVLEECVRANVGDLTFEEAYVRSKRVLNITVATAGQGGVPTLLNYLTTPNVVSDWFPLALSLVLNSSLTAVITVDLDSCCGIKCILRLILRSQRNNDTLQRPRRQHCSLGTSKHNRLSPLDTCVLYRPGLSSNAYCGAVQCEPFHRISSPSISDSLSTIRHARALPARNAQQDDVGNSFPRADGWARS